MPAKKKVHVGPHRFVRVIWGKKKTVIWRCTLPDCSHYKHDEFIVGLKSLCNQCGLAFLMTKDKARRAKPRCDSCQYKKDPLMGDLSALLANLGEP